MRRDSLLFEDILESIDFILKRIERIEKEEFRNNELIRSSIFYHFIIIGEATNNISRDIKISYSHIDWREIVDVGIYFIKKYYAYDYDIIWNTMVEYLPEYRNQIEVIIKNENLEIDQ
jgi:uncharacterized protein with HEPN domain